MEESDRGGYPISISIWARLGLVSTKTLSAQVTRFQSISIWFSLRLQQARFGFGFFFQSISGYPIWVLIRETSIRYQVTRFGFVWLPYYHNR